MLHKWDTKRIDSNMSESTSGQNCSEFSKCMEILHLMLDNEASPQQTTYVSEHIHECMLCFEQYEVEKQIRELIKKKLANVSVPQGLADEIKAKIQFNQS
ncbi:MAG: mycothiol system anti-sigma-R factor [Cyclobacteriaceae bacterium]|jgi:mycothiol system anti-sigma-R factor